MLGLLLHAPAGQQPKSRKHHHRPGSYPGSYSSMRIPARVQTHIPRRGLQRASHSGMGNPTCPACQDESR